ncbi:DUF6642 family protein [Xanthomarina sp. F2636L]|uniref:DUF6642 family protein n=1 Tax=Xanthomarina sp. F2636L TaxID=2996018 RepID=UPI00225E4211|nr:DUF6642 family protein [Xanthomarina sp. F2636L]MCX7550279.1 hypothetical protein [Xanthomarina sp. F2636L]
MTKRDYIRDIFCLEGDWDENLRNSGTIAPALNLLEKNCGIEVLHKTCSTKKEFKSRIQHIVNGNQKSYSRFQIIYLAFHGIDNEIDLGVESISLSKLSKYFSEDFSNRIIHFGSCKTISSKENVEELLRNTEALAVTGYSKDIDFIPSTVMDILFFEECQNWKRIETIEKKMKSKYGQLMNDLGFEIYY